jgi:hypothetical protein
MTNKSVTVKIELLQNSMTGSIAYEENHNTSTNDYGLVNLVVGNGATVTGALSDMNWSDGPYFMRVSADVEGLNGFREIGTTQLLSVPYAKHADTASVAYESAVSGSSTHALKSDTADYANQTELSKYADTATVSEVSQAVPFVGFFSRGEIEQTSGKMIYNFSTGTFQGLLNTPNGNIIDQENSRIGSNTIITFASSSPFGQTFIANNDGTLEQIAVYLYSTSDFIDITLSIHEGSATGTELGSVSASDQISDGGYFKFDLSSENITLTAGDTYAFLLDITTTSESMSIPAAIGNDLYPSGARTLNDGTEFDSQDLTFRTILSPSNTTYWKDL